MRYGVLETSDIPNVPDSWDVFMWSVVWFNRYTEPPDGLPRCLMQAVFRVPKGRGCPRPPADMLGLLDELGMGSGWTTSATFVPHPVKSWSPERRFKYRRQMLENRIRKKYPLFAERFIEEAMRQRPEYYGLAPEGERGGDRNASAESGAKKSGKEVVPSAIE